MAEQQTFRTAFNGFHRDDVVQYIEELNAKHAAEVNQLNNELQYLQEKLAEYESGTVVVENAEAAEAAPVVEGNNAELEAKLAEAEAQAQTAKDQLEEQKAENTRLQGLLDAAVARQNEVRNSVELDTYRRAERVEREARSRASAVYGQASNALTTATAKVDETAGQIADLAEAAMQQIKQLQLAISGSKQILRDTATTLYAIRPEDEE